jgi:serine protease inhibitor
MRPFVPQFIAHQAFLYFIKDNATGQILFVGRMANPLR